MSESICKQVQKLQQSHDELLYALKLLFSEFDGDGDFDDIMLAKIKAMKAIKNAEKVNET